MFTRTGKAVSDEASDELTAGAKGKQLYAGPIAVLLNNASASASELLANTLQEQKRARIFGLRSSGSLLGVSKHIQLKDGGELHVSQIGFVTAQGRTIEGHGVTPDQTTPVTLADLQQGRDAALEAAKAYFARLKTQPATVPASR